MKIINALVVIPLALMVGAAAAQAVVTVVLNFEDLTGQ